MLTNLNLLLGFWVPFTHLGPVLSNGQRSEGEDRGIASPFPVPGFSQDISDVIFFTAF